MTKNIIIRERTRADIDRRVERIIAGLDNPEPPLNLDDVRELLRLDRGYYTASDPGLLQETVSRLRIATKQVIERPALLAEAIQKFQLKALYLPDQKRILLDKDQPKPKHRWNEAHEVGHSLLPWHHESMLGDDKFTLQPDCHAQLEEEANYAAGRMLFLRDQFTDHAKGCQPNLESVRMLKQTFGNTMTTTFWRCVETWGDEYPAVGIISGHPHPRMRKEDFDPANPCRYFIQSAIFAHQFSKVAETDLFDEVTGYCRPGRGPIGETELPLADDNGDYHIFKFETFWNHYDALTLGIYLRPRKLIVGI